jgi:hypothetical protein
MTALAYNANRILTKVLTSEDTPSPDPNSGTSGQLPSGSIAPVGPGGTIGPIGPVPQGTMPKSSGSSGGSPAATSQPDHHQQEGNSTDEPGDDGKRTMKESQEALQTVRKFFALPFSQQMEAAAPRGSVLLGGLVECHGTHFVAVVDVVAAWDLSEEQIVMHNTKIRHITPRRIAPRGGSRMPPHGPHRPPGPPMF